MRLSPQQEAEPFAAELSVAGRLLRAVNQFRERWSEGRAAMRRLAAEGRLTPWYTEVKGLANAPQAFVDMVNGGNSGSVIIRP